MLHLILKASTGCNSDCIYCEEWCRGGTGASMSLGTVKRLFELADDYLATRPDEFVEFVWHGGEPLLLGPAYYVRVWELQQACCETTGARIRHGLQTNLTCFGEEFIPVLRRLGIASVGTSYDPEPHVRGGGPDRDSDAYNRSFLRAISVLEHHGMTWDLSYVVARHSLADPMRVFHFLTNLALGRGLNLNPVLTLDGVPRDCAITPEEYLQFLGAVFPFWLARRARFPSVVPFAELMHGIETGALGPDAMAFGVCDARRNRLTIGPDGLAHPGGWTDAGPEPTLGNVNDTTFDDVLASPEFRRMQAHVRELQGDACARCRLAPACCADEDALIVPGRWCRARVGFVEQFLEPLTGHRVEHAGPDH